MVNKTGIKSLMLFIYGFLFGIFIAGLLLFFFNKTGVNLNLVPITSSTEQFSKISSDEIKCTNGSSSRQNIPLVNLNYALIEDLKSLPGIGDAKAKSIIAWREKYGQFKNISELMYISGISDSLFQQICNMITIEN